MQIGDVLPIVIPGTALQVLMQAYFIKHCWENARLSQRQKFIYILAIIVCNLPAAAVYLINSRERIAAQGSDFQDVDIDGNVRQGISVLLIVAFEIFAMRIIADNAQNTHYLLIVSLLAYSFLIMLINNLVLGERPLLLYYLLPIMQLLLAIPLQYLDSSYNAQYILVIIAAGIINRFPMPLAKTYSIAAFCAFLVGSTAKVYKYYDALDYNDILSYFYVNTLVFLLIIVAFYTLKNQLITNRRLDAAFRRVREQASQIEKMGALAERNRIAAEIHDTVGHRLTSAVISIEAAEKLFEQDAKEAVQKLSLAKEQVKRGLEDIRSSVRTIRMGYEGGFEHALGCILEDVRQTSGLTINCIAELKSELLSVQQGILLLAIKECTTNALKHGRCTEIDLLVQEYKGEVRLTFSDDGQGADQAVPGSGLSIMKERVQSIGGTLQINSVKGEGFTVSISIPIGTETEGDCL